MDTNPQNVACSHSPRVQRDVLHASDVDGAPDMRLVLRVSSSPLAHPHVTASGSRAAASPNGS